MDLLDPNDSLMSTDRERLDHEWENPLATEWLGAEAAVRVRDGRGRRPFDRRLIGIMLVSLGFAVGFLAGGLTWCGVGHLVRRKRAASP